MKKRRGVCKKTHTSCPGQELIVLQTTRSWKRIKDLLKWCGAKWKAGEAIAMEMLLMCACVSVSASRHASMQSSLVWTSLGPHQNVFIVDTKVIDVLYVIPKQWLFFCCWARLLSALGVVMKQFGMQKQQCCASFTCLHISPPPWSYGI